ncbi:unnamed protein product [Nesidiocoris tenuis]|uniref:Uncharacterized protein n=1 Tax=Nesidiocoris tenuis TaxID=355587 RepID=A0A6H5GM46_9HEMI|nr:unnamed protein product [Nesidiocoris tenuis]
MRRAGHLEHRGGRWPWRYPLESGDVRHYTQMLHVLVDHILSSEDRLHAQFTSGRQPWKWQSNFINRIKSEARVPGLFSFIKYDKYVMPESSSRCGDARYSGCRTCGTPSLVLAISIARRQFSILKIARKILNDSHSPKTQKTQIMSFSRYESARIHNQVTGICFLCGGNSIALHCRLDVRLFTRIFTQHCQLQQSGFEVHGTVSRRWRRRTQCLRRRSQIGPGASPAVRSCAASAFDTDSNHQTAKSQET